ncbi:vesicle-associated membrane protein 7 [Hetaerina americana]|uniref:vesicle-associated membrane protein 7 n=1 Tax=Hetaerina americana TaxID=62018 RepID=UPI003A7F4BCA
MPILYSVIARGTVILAKHACRSGNFAEVTEQVIAMIDPDVGKSTYSHGSYLFHYLCEDRIIFLCISDDGFERTRAFLYLNEIKNRFNSTYGIRAQTALAYSMNTEFSMVLANEMKRYSESQDIDMISRVHGQLEEVKEIMVKNIDNVTMRGEKLELLVNKTEDLSSNAINFRKSSRNLARTMFWKNVKLYLVIALVILVVIYFIISIACGGLTWSSCVGQ